MNLLCGRILVRIAYVFILSGFLFSCREDNRATNGNLASDRYEASGVEKQLGDVNDIVVSRRAADTGSLQDYFNIDFIPINSEVNISIGGDIEQFINYEDRILLVDKANGIMTMLSKSGDVLWQISPNVDGFSSFTSIRVVNSNFEQDQIEVFDGAIYRLYTFDMNGKLINTRDQKIDYDDKVYFSPSIAFYSTYGYMNGYQTEEAIDCNLLVESNGDIVKGYLCESVDMIGDYVDYNDFSWSDEGLLYQKNMFSTVYIIDSLDIVPYKSIKFENAEDVNEVVYRFEDVMQRFTYINDNGIPFLKNVIKSNDLYFISYQKSDKDHFAIVQNNETVLNSTVFKVDDKIITAPRAQTDRSFIRKYEKGQYEYLQSLDDVSLFEYKDMFDYEINDDGGEAVLVVWELL